MGPKEASHPSRSYIASLQLDWRARSQAVNLVVHPTGFYCDLPRVFCRRAERPGAKMSNGHVQDML